jgi:hypothetical protein
LGTESNAKIKNAQEVLRVSVNKAFVPHFTQEIVTIKRGNSTLKYAGVPSFGEGTLDFHDFIGAEPKAVLMAWQNLSYDVRTETVGCVMPGHQPYKKDCYLIEYGPDYCHVRTWKLYGCWISSISEDDYTADSGDKHMVHCTIQYDHAEIDMTDAPV